MYLMIVAYCHPDRLSGQELSAINESSVVLSPSDVSVDPCDLDEVSPYTWPFLVRMTWYEHHVEVHEHIWMDS